MTFFFFSRWPRNIHEVVGDIRVITICLACVSVCVINWNFVFCFFFAATTITTNVLLKSLARSYEREGFVIGFFQKKQNKTPLGKEFAPRRYIYPVSFRGLLTNWDVSIKKRKKKGRSWSISINIKCDPESSWKHTHTRNIQIGHSRPARFELEKNKIKEKRIRTRAKIKSNILCSKIFKKKRRPQTQWGERRETQNRSCPTPTGLCVRSHAVCADAGPHLEKYSQHGALKRKSIVSFFFFFFFYPTSF